MSDSEAWTCPICCEARRDVAYATPCNHQFCLGCIQRWAILKSSCPDHVALRTWFSVWVSNLWCSWDTLREGLFNFKKIHLLRIFF
uniref:RING-type domain-containing protein n=1 Tax=Meleagris gallopavo TaxID=9103 RepID=A0A803Y1C8_MELGA